MPKSKCIFNTSETPVHSYSYCVKPVTDVAGNPDNLPVHDHAMNVVSSGWNLIKGTVTDPKDSIRDECGGKLGNKYVLETGVKCSNGEPRHKYVNTICGAGDGYSITGGRSSGNCDGTIPNVMNSVFKIGQSGANLFNSFIDDPIQECSRVKLSCHVLRGNKNKPELITGDSGYVNIPINELDDIDKSDIIESFSNINNNNFDNYINNYLNDNAELFDTNNNHGDHDNYDNYGNYYKYNTDNMLINSYYVLLSLFMLYIIYKLRYKSLSFK